MGLKKYKTIPDKAVTMTLKTIEISKGDSLKAQAIKVLPK